MTAMAEGMALAGRLGDAAEIIDEAIAVVERNGDLFMLPEVLRIKASTMISLDQSLFAKAEECLLHSRDLAIKQGALAWELRTATTLAALRSRQGHAEQGRRALLPVYARFTEGFDNADVKAAHRLLHDLA
jgi:predicted ATPase